MSNNQSTAMQAIRNVISGKQARMLSAGSIGTLIEYYDYYLYGLASATIFSSVFFPKNNPVIGTIESFATFAVGFLLRPIGGLLFGQIGDRYGRKTVLMTTVIGMGLATTAIGMIPSAVSIGIFAPLLLIFFRMMQGLFVGGEMGGAASLVVEHAPSGHHGLYGAFLISGAGVANVCSSGFMAALESSHGFFMTWGWRMPFWFALVLAIIAIVLRSKVEDSDEFLQMQQKTQGDAKRASLPFRQLLHHPKNMILGILIGLPQSIAGYIILTFGVSYMVSKGTTAQIGFIGTMIVGLLQIVVAPMWGSISDKIGRKKLYIISCIAFSILVYPAFMLYGVGSPVFIWLGMIIGFVIPGVAMQATLQTMLAEMFDVESRTTGINIGYQISNTLGGGFAPLIAASLTAAFNSIIPVIIYVVIIAILGIVGTVYASLRVDRPNASRLYALE